MSKLRDDQIEEWFENPVTLHFLSILKTRLDDTFQHRAEVFFPCEPQRTQEVKANLLGAEGELGDLIQALEEKDLSLIEEEVSADEPVRNPSLRRPSAH